MRHEKIFRREDGTQYQITVEYVSYRFDSIEWRFSVVTRAKGKRNWQHLMNTDSYTYRRLSMEEREATRKETALCHVTKDEVQQTALELWEKIKPKLDV